MTITITNDQVKQAHKEIREWFPGPDNTAIRATLRRQLADQVNQSHGQHNDPLFPVRVKLGYGILFLNGSGDQRTQNFNEDVNKALGLLQ